MKYENAFIHRINDFFLVINANDIESLSSDLCMPIRNLIVDMDAITCLSLFPNLKNLVLRPGIIKKESLEHLKGLPIESLKIDYCSDEIDEYTLDLSWFPNLQLLVSKTSRSFINVDKCKQLKTLVVQNWIEHNLKILQNSSILALKLLSRSLRNLNGIEQCDLISLSIAYQPKLSNITSILSNNRLESLQIDHCSKIDLFDLPKLDRLIYLELFGSQEAKNLSFLNNFPNLCFFVFDVKILDGQLKPLMLLTHSVSIIDRKHYTIKDDALPKSTCAFHSNTLPDWLEILPEALSRTGDGSPS